VSTFPLAVASAGHGSGAVPTVLLALAFAIVCAKLAGELLERLGQPAVLGELMVGILAGNAALLGGPDLSALASSETLTVMAELGAVLLLFHVGLESTPKEMMAVGGRAALVAVVGVVMPMLLGFGVGELMRPQEPWMLHAFLGAMLAATSVGITARVLKDADALRAPFARIILGAAVIDDVLGLVSASVLGFAAMLTLAAILGKLACSTVAPKGVSGLTLGLGMMPRGEVGLIFAGIGAQLVLAGRPVVDTGTYAAAVFMVVVTTMLTPPLLLWSIRRQRATAPA
jgi:Kef-type K+ transport system membrane component KefB